MHDASTVQVPFDDVATAVSKWMAGAGGAAVAATGVTVDGEPVRDRCLTVAAVATKAILCAPPPSTVHPQLLAPGVARCALALIGCLMHAIHASRWCRFVYGEGLYTEVFGDTPSMYLPAAQLQLAADLRAVADARGMPLVGVYVGGRDRLLAQFEALFDAHLTAFFPGPFGAAAITDTIAGVHCPCARLPITLHMADKQSLPYWHSHADYASIPASLDDMSPRCAAGILLRRCAAGWGQAWQGRVISAEHGLL